MGPELLEAIDRGDLDEAVRLLDGVAASRAWDDLVAARDRCRAVIERGHQMWPAAEYAEYRLALEAPPAYAGPVVTEQAGRFALGPLWEVAASTHTWEEIAGHIPPGPARTLVAYERALRGDDPSGDPDLDLELLDIPVLAEAWEPDYEVAEYRSSAARFPTPETPVLHRTDLPEAGGPLDDETGSEALRAVAAPWQDQSNGSVAAIGVTGPAGSAIAALGQRQVLAAEIGPDVALARLAWAGASGGAYGPRRGSPMGRFAAWWAASVITGCEWPCDPGELGDAVASARWLAWEPLDAKPGWSASTAVEFEGRSWALLAIDSHREGDLPPELAGDQ